MFQKLEYPLFLCLKKTKKYKMQHGFACSSVIKASTPHYDKL